MWREPCASASLRSRWLIEESPLGDMFHWDHFLLVNAAKFDGDAGDEVRTTPQAVEASRMVLERCSCCKKKATFHLRFQMWQAHAHSIAPASRRLLKMWGMKRSGVKLELSGTSKRHHIQSSFTNIHHNQLSLLLQSLYSTTHRKSRNNSNNHSFQNPRPSSLPSLPHHVNSCPDTLLNRASTMAPSLPAASFQTRLPRIRPILTSRNERCELADSIPPSSKILHISRNVR